MTRRCIRRAFRHQNPFCQFFNTSKVFWIFRLSIDFVSFRGTLREIMCHPYDDKSQLLVATKYRGTVYILKLDTDEKKMEELNMSDDAKKRCSMGFKFEQYMTGDVELSEIFCSRFSSCQLRSFFRISNLLSNGVS